MIYQSLIFESTYYLDRKNYHIIALLAPFLLILESYLTSRYTVKKNNCDTNKTFSGAILLIHMLGPAVL